MALKPLGHRIIVKPDDQPDATDSGLILPQDRDHVPVSGIVYAVGTGPERDQKIRTASILRCLSILEELAEKPTSQEVDLFAQDAIREMGRYKNQIEQYAGSVSVGDRVVYPSEAGLRVTEDGQAYILLNEDDVVVIATEEVTAA